MRKIKLLSIITVLCIMTLFFSVFNSSASSPVTATDPKETVAKAYQKFQSLKSYHMTIDFTSVLSFRGNNINTVMKGEGDVRVKPMLGKNIMNITMDITSDNAPKKIERQLVQYFEETGNQITVYSNIDNQWIKQSTPNYYPLNEYDNYIKAITSVTQISEDANSTIFEVIASGSYLQENLERYMASAGMKNMKVTADLLQDLGDFKYTIAVDKKTSLISRMDIDLSDFMPKIANKLVESQNMPADQKTVIKEMFDNMKIITTVAFSEINRGEKITIPKEAKEAREVVPNPMIQTKPSKAAGL
ncbi:MAG TPA: hypothetical protein PKA28_19195 [Methylomusa anaerophila]|uniref:Uncharacterized protein n=1 Tax=Methylomusa anaerophila TaxID=1930071 RepID=A0A348AFQ3_9FIRM|nr:DUF6612 family protein [Methylomusa anaerophila]BBB89901.1 hypothetical protein MAMMFC1_00541 [Methylomusa anaerophila]HML90561.1 hypothetical protein [Methylomusa anaerophila]